MGNLNKTNDGSYWAEQDKDSDSLYSLDWSDWLAVGASIDSSVWTADAGLVLSGAAFSGSVASVVVSGGTAGVWYTLVNEVTSGAQTEQRTIRIFINDQTIVSTSVLFPDRRAAVDELRRDRLALLFNTLLPKVELSDDYLFNKLLAAEADAEMRLRVYFSPVTIFAYEPTQSEIDALNGGRWEEEAAYDYEPMLWNVEDWAYTALRKSPVISVDAVKLAYPAPIEGVYTVPTNWVRLDKKYGHIRFVPTGSAISAGPLANFVMNTFGGGRNIPQMLQIKYTAGMQNVKQRYPQLVDIVKKMAVLRIVQDAFLPSSGSISGDGLSESMSVQMDAYHDGVDSAIDSLSQSIHGVRMIVL